MADRATLRAALEWLKEAENWMPVQDAFGNRRDVMYGAAEDRKHRETLRAELERLQAEVERLREAMEKAAQVADTEAAQWAGDGEIDEFNAVAIDTAQCIAREIRALKGGQHE